jgi:site-specific recombinase XerD
MPDIKLFINDKYPKKNGDCAIYLVVHLDYKSLKFNTGVCTNPGDWDYENKKVRGKSKVARDKNLIIDECKARMNDIFVRYRLQHVHLTADLLKNEWKNPSRRINFYSFFDEALQERKKELAPNTYKQHKSNLTTMKDFRKELSFSELNPDFIAKYSRWLKLEQKNDINTIHAKMRVLRSYLNIAIRKNIIQENPFNQVKLKKAAVSRVFLSEEELQKLWKAYQDKKLTEAKTKILRHFLFMCFTGIRISDLKSLEPSNVNGKMLIFNAVKTKNSKKTLLRIPLNKYARQLIKDEGVREGKLFNTISEQKMNTYLKKIPENTSIEKEITNHSGRHTFATIWLEKTHDLAQLQSLLGHSKITETMVYVHITDTGLRHQMASFEDSLEL